MEAAENIEISEVLQNNNSGTVNEILQNTYSISCIALELSRNVQSKKTQNLK